MNKPKNIDYPVWSKGQPSTVTGVLTQSAARYGERTFLEFSGATYTYQQVLDDSHRVARGLIALGVQAGDVVTSILDNNYDAVIAWFGINFAGAISVPVNTAYKGEFLRHQMSDAGAAIVIAESDYAQRVLDIACGLPKLTTLLYRGSGVQGADTPLTIEAFDQHKLPGKPVNVDVQPESLSMLIYTGGTTGPSKGCMMSHNYACNMARQSYSYAQSYTPEDVIWTPLPLFHLNATCASVLACAMAGAQVSIYPRFSVSNFWPEIKRTGATIASLLGSMIVFVAEAKETEAAKSCKGQLRSIRGAPFTSAMQEIWRSKFGVKNCGSNAFGLTECSLLTSLKAGEFAPPGSSGKRNPEFDVRIVDDGDNEVPPNMPGEIICRPRLPHIMFEGYWNRPEDTQKQMRNLWFHTGDIGKFDEDDFFYFVDRKKDYLRRRGENISSFEVESAFRAHPAIEDIAAHAVFSDSGEEDDLKITLVLNSGEVLSEEELYRWSIEQLPYFAVPRYIEFRRELPRNPVGRILKYQLRDEGCTEATWDADKSNIKLVKR